MCCFSRSVSHPGASSLTRRSDYLSGNKRHSYSWSAAQFLAKLFSYKPWFLFVEAESLEAPEKSQCCNSCRHVFVLKMLTIHFKDTQLKGLCSDGEQKSTWSSYFDCKPLAVNWFLLTTHFQNCILTLLRIWALSWNPEDHFNKVL